jgi:hypothetical protein
MPGCRIQFVPLSRSNCDLRTEFAQHFRHLKAEASRSAGDKGRPSLQILQLRKTHDLPLIGTIFPFGLEALLRPHKFLQIDEILPHAFLQDLPRVVAHLRFLWGSSRKFETAFSSQRWYGCGLPCLAGGSSFVISRPGQSSTGAFSGFPQDAKRR